MTMNIHEITMLVLIGLSAGLIAGILGVGGAIIDLSDAQDELEETLLKSRATVGALSESDLTVIPMAAVAG